MVADRNLAEQVFERLKRLEQFKNAKNVSVYISMPTGEVITTNIIHHLLRSGNKKSIFEPITNTNIKQERIALYLVVPKPTWTW